MKELDTLTGRCFDSPFMVEILCMTIHGMYDMKRSRVYESGSPVKPAPNACTDSSSELVSHYLSLSFLLSSVSTTSTSSGLPT